MTQRDYAILISLRIICLIVPAIPFHALWYTLEELKKSFMPGVYQIDWPQLC